MPRSGEGGADLPFPMFCRAVGPVVALDLLAYKPEFLQPRVDRRRKALGLPSLRAYRDHLLADGQERRRLRDGITAGVSGFYRDPALFNELAQAHLPALRARAPGPLRVWCAGVGAGQELYTVACLLADAGLLARAELVGTDVNATALAKAEAAVYARDELEDAPSHWINAYFRPVALGLAVAAEIRRRVSFRYGDVLRPPLDGDLDLVLCRNVAIYLSPAIQAQLYARLAETLRPGGILFVGSAEWLDGPDRLGLQRLSRTFYARQPEPVTAEGAL